MPNSGERILTISNDGRELLVLKFVTRSAPGTFSNPGPPVEREPVYRLEDGRRVALIDGEFLIVETGERLARVVNAEDGSDHLSP